MACIAAAVVTGWQIDLAGAGSSARVIDVVFLTAMVSLGGAVLALVAIPIVKENMLSGPMDREEITTGDDEFLGRLYRTYLVIWGLTLFAVLPPAVITMGTDRLAVLFCPAAPLYIAALGFWLRYRPPAMLVDEHFAAQQPRELGPPGA